MYMIEKKIEEALKSACRQLFGADVPENLLQVQKTRTEFTGDYTVVVFPLLRISKKKPEQTAEELGSYFVDNIEEVSSFNVIKGFLNLSLSIGYWLDFYRKEKDNNSFGKVSPGNDKPVVLEYSAPNTNKPLHLGHIRNNLLGWSVAEVLQAAGRKVAKVNLINDRGIHICKSMLAWQKWGDGKTPETNNLKGDKFVGDYYVLFDKAFKEEVAELMKKGMDKEDAEKKSSLLNEAKEMLKKWEQGDEEVRKLWVEMNGWVYDGFDVTYQRMGVDFDKVYYESDTYLLGKKLVEEGLAKGVFYKKNDGSVWCDLTDEGLDEKLLLRADGTSVYMTQIWELPSCGMMISTLRNWFM